MNPALANIVIRDVTGIAEMREVERLQKEVWGVTDLDVLPALVMRPQTDLGAILMGAFASEKMVGFVFGFPGIHNGKTIIHSDMLAVAPEFRAYGLGYLLKLAQREKAIEMGIDEISWTYDPLQLRNANLNFGKLGIVAERYEVNYYGETSSFLHNFGTDRLWAKWELNSERVKERIKLAGPPRDLANVVQELPVLVQVGDDDEPLTMKVGTGPRVALQIPSDINKLKAEGGGKAERWREATREVFTSLMESGYVVEEFVVNDNRAGSYILNAR